MAKKTGCPPFSDSISQFCSLMDSAKKDYAWNYEEMRKMDQLTQDYLHKLELEQLTYSERAKVATQLQDALSNLENILEEEEKMRDHLDSSSATYDEADEICDALDDAVDALTETISCVDAAME